MRHLPIILLLATTLSSHAQQRERRGRGPDNAPALGAAIPKVSAKSPDGSKSVDLAKPKRHTVLIFGSHT